MKQLRMENKEKRKKYFGKLRRDENCNESLSLLVLLTNGNSNCLTYLSNNDQ